MSQDPPKPSELAVRRIEPFDGPIDAVVRVPGSKSITNRALLAAGLATGSSQLTGVLFADDTRAMLMCLAALGADVAVDEPSSSVAVVGIGGRSIPSEGVLDARQSGTTSRFLLPVLSALPGDWRLDGDAQLRARPFDDQIAALGQLGARMEPLGDPGRLPLRIRGALLAGGELDVPTDVSSQFLSGLLLAAPLLDGELIIRAAGTIVSRPYIDMTVAVMRAFGAHVDEPDVDDPSPAWAVAGGGYAGADFSIEPDASAASYAFGAAAVTRGRVTVPGLSRAGHGAVSLQGDVGFVDVLAQMGAMVHDDGSSITVDCRADVVGAGGLIGVDVDMSQVSDTAQTFAAVAATADGSSSADGIGFIRFKETDRIAAVVNELLRLGVNAAETDDGFTVVPGPVRAAVVETYDDHRMAMSFALLGLVNDGIDIAGPECVAKTFPEYWTVLESMRPDSSDVGRILAIDGPAGSGKSTISKAVAAALDVAHLDTGAMYRAVTFAVLERGVDPKDTAAVIGVAAEVDVQVTDRVTVDGVDATVAIRTPEVTAAVSTVSAIPIVRREVVRLQRELALAPDGCVVEGRDIGTVVFTDAPLKVYLTADPRVRAARRLAEMESKGLTGPGSATLDEIAADIERRDHEDSSRIDSPLRPADDAVMVDTSDRTVDELVDEIVLMTRRAWNEDEHE